MDDLLVEITSLMKEMDCQVEDRKTTKFDAKMMHHQLMEPLTTMMGTFFYNPPPHTHTHTHTLFKMMILQLIISQSINTQYEHN